MAAAGEPADALAVTGLSHRIGGREILAGIELAVQPGRFTVLLGQNGAGKTTLFSLVTRLYGAQSGSVRVFGRDLAADPGRALALMGVVFQQRALDPDLSARQNLRYHAALHGMPGSVARQRIAAELERVGLAKEADRKIRSFSGGEMRRIEIARALLHEPRLLLCDEATVGLDIRSRAAILADVRGLVRDRGLTVLWATHLIDEVEAADPTIVLHRGRILRQGPAASIISDLGAGGLQDAFRRLTEAA
ncbi:MAG: ATP-binding cassette domain-containing protein [Inquilinus limosus]|uniref:ATP-binding cassette domain-containing protein n=1 Tax=Inquilinus limosus TaxID=171674 RepID=A0A952FPV9_9PROT|nr:ATP-binding cassette domain-containing protein [Inquilinus limosus]